MPTYYNYTANTLRAEKKKKNIFSNLLVLGINIEDPVWFDVVISNENSILFLNLEYMFY